MRFRHILHPTDFSHHSSGALHVANQLASDTGARLWLVHVVQPVPAPAVPTTPTMPIQPAWPDVVALQEQLRKEAEDRLRRLAREEVSEGVQVQTTVTVGNPGDEIPRLAEEEGVDLIVTSTRGQSGWRRFIFGSVAEKVIRQAPCPILVLPQEDPDES